MGRAFRAVVLGCIALPLAALSSYQAAVGYYAAYPSGAPSFLRLHPRVVTRANDLSLLSGEPVPAAYRREVARNTRQILKETPLDAVALRQLSLLEADEGEQGGLADALSIAERISRRDIGTEIALFDLSAKQGEYDAALRHLDRAVTVHPQVGASVFPLLASALGDAKFRATVSRYSARPWFRSFLAVAADAAAPVEAAAWVLESRIALSDKDGSALPRLLTRLVDDGRYEIARRLVITSGAGTDAAIDQAGFTAATTQGGLAPLTWRLTGNEIIRAEVEGEATLGIEVQPGGQGQVAERIMHLSPGRYVLDQHVEGTESATGGALNWLITCGAKASKSEPIWEQAVPVPPAAAQYRSSFVIPQNCPLQRWKLSVLAPEGQSAALIRLRLQLHR